MVTRIHAAALQVLGKALVKKISVIRVIRGKQCLHEQPRKFHKLSSVAVCTTENIPKRLLLRFQRIHGRIIYIGVLNHAGCRWLNHESWLDRQLSKSAIIAKWRWP
ncbi:MAG: hypothetical protein NTW21_15215 [Verrucomicrobia bacterium]|nr:hypothetical protein [Verrucomicrobiota bacterium]